MAAESKGTTRKQCTMFVSHISGMVIAVWEISCVYIYFFPVLLYYASSIECRSEKN